MTTEQKKSNTKNIILWIAQFLLAITFIWAGTMKIFKPMELPWQWIKENPNLVKVTGILDLLVGIGFLLEVITFFAYSFKYGYIHPYSYCGFYYFEQINNRLKVPTGINIHLLAISYFIVFSIINYFLFIRQKERG